MQQINAETSSSGDKHIIELQASIKGLDWQPIRKEESPEAIAGYFKALGMHISLVNMDNKNGLVYKVNKALIKDDCITQVFKLQVQEAGTYNIKAVFSDCYGMNYR